MDNISFAERLKQRLREIDAQFDPKPVVEETIVPYKEIEMPEQIGPLFSVYKRTPTGYNKAVFFGLMEDEARAACSWLNRLAQDQRKQKVDERHEHGLECIFDPNEILLYDVVAMDTEQESPYWNPPVIIK